MPPTGFLSEMTAEPIHGGGVTLQRVLGSDLGRFNWFAKTILFHHEEVPRYEGSGSLAVPYWPIQKALRPFTGCRVAAEVSQHRWTRRLFTRHVTRRLEPICASPGLTRLLVCPQAEISLLALRRLRQRHAIEYMSWVMDDHLVSWRNGRWHYPPGMEKVMAEHLQQAREVFTISPVLADFYRRRFGVESTVLCGPASLAKPCEEKELAGSVPRLCYFGSLGRWQNDALDLLAPAIEAKRGTLDIFTHQASHLSPILSSAGPSLLPPVPPADVLRIAAGYDAMVLPISFREELRNMSHFNIATKFSECLASPIPTLLIGPDDCAMVSIARAAGACLIVDKACRIAVNQALELLGDGRMVADCLRAEHALLEREFAPAVMAARWRSASRFLFDDGE